MYQLTAVQEHATMDMFWAMGLVVCARTVVTALMEVLTGLIKHGHDQENLDSMNMNSKFLCILTVTCYWCVCEDMDVCVYASSGCNHITGIEIVSHFV